jgi:hypothetical protein
MIRRFVERADESGAPVRGRQYAAQMLLAPALLAEAIHVYEAHQREIDAEINAERST